MTATATTAATSAAAAAAAAASASASSGSSGSSASSLTNGLADTNFTNFLQLLTTQLQNQDPTDPTNTDDLTQEIASLSEVEQQLSTNSDLSQLISLYTQSQTNGMVSYIGKQVDANGNQISLQSGEGVLAYDLPANASSATVTIQNSTGQTVFSAPGTTIAGRNEVLWNGSTTGGTQATDGTYTYTITATDSSGKALTATTFTTGIVQSVDTSSGTAPVLNLGGNLTVPANSVVSVSDVPTVASSGSNTTTGTSS